MAAVTATPHYPVISLRVVQAIPDAELERRRKRIRGLMAQKEIDILVFHSQGGYLRYVTNYMGTGSIEYLLLPLQAELLFFGRGEGGERGGFWKTMMSTFIQNRVLNSTKK
jgi:hypothetical protein